MGAPPVKLSTIRCDNGLTPLSYRERRLLAHVGRWGSDGYPVRKLRKMRWTWEYQGFGPPTVFATKREAVCSFEAWKELALSRISAELRAMGRYADWYEVEEG